MNFLLGFILGFLFSIAMGFVMIMIDEKKQRDNFKAYFNERQQIRKDSKRGKGQAKKPRMEKD